MDKIRVLRLSGNALKLLAAFFMLVDHVGVLLFPSVVALRAIGRLSFPIFAYMIAEGAHKTRDRLGYFLRLFTLGAICQLAYLIFSPGSIYINILLTFSVGVLLVWAFDRVKLSFLGGYGKLELVLSVIVFAALLAGAVILSSIFLFDYALPGIVTPLFCSIFRSRDGYPDSLVRFDNKFVHVALLAIPLTFLVAESAPVQLFSFLALPLLLLYSGNRGKYRMKYFFYVFYPLHLLVLELISFLIK